MRPGHTTKVVPAKLGPNSAKLGRIPASADASARKRRTRASFVCKNSHTGRRSEKHVGTRIEQHRVGIPARIFVAGASDIVATRHAQVAGQPPQLLGRRVDNSGFVAQCTRDPLMVLARITGMRRVVVPYSLRCCISIYTTNRRTIFVWRAAKAAAKPSNNTLTNTPGSICGLSFTRRPPNPTNFWPSLVNIGQT